MFFCPLVGRVEMRFPDDELELELDEDEDELELDEELELDDELEDDELELLEDDELLLDEELLEVGFTPPWPPQPTNSAAASSAVRGRRVAPDVGLNNVAMRFT